MTNPGPATSTDEATSSSTPESTTRCANSRGLVPIRLGERQRAVDLGIRTVGRTDRGIRAAAFGNDLRPGEFVEDGVQKIGERSDGIRHAWASLPDRVERRTDR